jgi:hypothetical protein
MKTKVAPPPRPMTDVELALLKTAQALTDIPIELVRVRNSQDYSGDPLMFIDFGVRDSFKPNDQHYQELTDLKRKMLPGIWGYVPEESYPIVAYSFTKTILENELQY